MSLKWIGALGAGLLVAGVASAQTVAPKTDPGAAANAARKSQAAQATAAPASGANSFTEAQARTRIESGGYTHVSALTKDEVGLWQGTATRAGQTVQVALDFKGDIASK